MAGCWGAAAVACWKCCSGPPTRGEKFGPLNAAPPSRFRPPPSANPGRTPTAAELVAIDCSGLGDCEFKSISDICWFSSITLGLVDMPPTPTPILMCPFWNWTGIEICAGIWDEVEGAGLELPGIPPSEGVESLLVDEEEMVVEVELFAESSVVDEDGILVGSCTP